jgi:sugar lactone lactonase YvrE
MSTATVLHRQASEDDRFLPEGPRSIVLEGRPAIAWVNIQTAAEATHGDIHVRFWDGEHRSLRQERRPGFLLPTDREDTLLVGREKEIGLLNLSTNHFTALATIEDPEARTIINDGEIVPGGRAVVFGTKDVLFADAIANLYLLTVDDWQVNVLAAGQTCSNGKVFTQEDGGLWLYDIDTPLKNVVRYRLDLESRTVSDAVEVLDLREQRGFPDGMVDAGDGTVIIAFYNPAPVEAGRAIRFDLQSSEAVEEWTTPGSPRVTCPLLIEREGGVRLLLTTATEGMSMRDRGKCPAAGDLFWAQTSISRLPAAEFVRVPSR